MIVSVTLTNSRESEIEGAVQSVIPHVDRVLLVDTGATDRTVERARAVAGPKLVVAQHAWVDFSAARNAGLDAAKTLGAEWIVLVDSDERLHLGALDLRGALARTRANVLLIESADGVYQKEKILRASSDARFFGPTHEALSGGPREVLAGATFSELGKTPEQLAQKYARDVAVLSAHVETCPDEPRWWYYLGQSLEGLGERSHAAEAFGRCVDCRKGGDEAAWAAYKQAENLQALERFEESIAAAARGLAANATFAECAWIAAISSERLGRANQAVAWARVAEAVGRYRGCGPNRTWYRHPPALYELPYDVLRRALPDEAGRERANADFRAAKLARLGAANESDLDRMSISRGIHESIRNEMRSMLRPPPLAAACPSARSTRIRFDPPNGRRPCNPSLCWHDGTMRCVVRTVNYTLINGKYVIDDPDGIVRTENYLGTLHPSGELLNPTPMRDLDPSPRQPSRIVGYEDVRLVSVRDRGKSTLTGSATVCDREAGQWLVARLVLDAAGNVERAVVQPSHQPCEKNWMPLSVRGELTWIYSLDPTAILPGPLRNCPLALDHLRGGAAIAVEDGYLCVTHEVVEATEGRIYLHRFVRLDDRFRVTAASPAWVFAHHGVEFCAGLVRDGEDLVLSYGVDDREAWVARVNVEEVEAMGWVASSRARASG